MEEGLGQGGRPKVREAAKVWFRWERVRPDLGQGHGLGEEGIAEDIFKMSNYQLLVGGSEEKGGPFEVGVTQGDPAPRGHGAMSGDICDCHN